MEWAILLSQSAEGKPRYPTKDWVDELAKLSLPLAGHICGAWVRNLVTKNSAAVFEERPEFLNVFPRIQLNFSPYHAEEKFLDVLKPFKNQFIFQVGSKAQEEKEVLLRRGLEMGLDLAVLFDRSGGKGLLPTEWPQIIEPFYCIYAGGLGPESLAEQLPKIAEIVGDKTVGIDMETKVRSNDDTLFDLEKVKACLEIAQPWVV